MKRLLLRFPVTRYFMNTWEEEVERDLNQPNMTDVSRRIYMANHTRCSQGYPERLFYLLIAIMVAATIVMICMLNSRKTFQEESPEPHFIQT